MLKLKLRLRRNIAAATKECVNLTKENIVVFVLYFGSNLLQVISASNIVIAEQHRLDVSSVKILW